MPAVDLITRDQLVPQPHELVLASGTPNTIAGWKALAGGLLTDQSCVFHRNLEISSRYAWIYKFLPAYFFEAIDGGRRVLEDRTTSAEAWFNPTSTLSRAHSPGSSPSARR